jgi:hypothetical protein
LGHDAKTPGHVWDEALQLLLTYTQPHERSHHMNRRTLVATTLASLTLMLAAGVSDGATTARHSLPAWERALIARSRALDRRDHLGSYQPIGAGLVPAGHNPSWLRALDLRSIALDRRYHLGSFTSPIVL